MIPISLSPYLPMLSIYVKHPYLYLPISVSLSLSPCLPISLSPYPQLSLTCHRLPLTYLLVIPLSLPSPSCNIPHSPQTADRSSKMTYDSTNPTEFVHITQTTTLHCCNTSCTLTCSCIWYDMVAPSFSCIQYDVICFDQAGLEHCTTWPSMHGRFRMFCSGWYVVWSTADVAIRKWYIQVARCL